MRITGGNYPRRKHVHQRHLQFPTTSLSLTLISINPLKCPKSSFLGATGTQGGSVIRIICRLQSSPRNPKGIIRGTTKPGAQALSKEGIELRYVCFSFSPDDVRQQVGESILVQCNPWIIIIRQISDGHIILPTTMRGCIISLMNFTDVILTNPLYFRESDVCSHHVNAIYHTYMVLL